MIKETTDGELTYFQDVMWITVFTDYTSKQNQTTRTSYLLGLESQDNPRGVV